MQVERLFSCPVQPIPKKRSSRQCDTHFEGRRIGERLDMRLAPRGLPPASLYAHHIDKGCGKLVAEPDSFVAGGVEVDARLVCGGCVYAKDHGSIATIVARPNLARHVDVGREVHVLSRHRPQAVLRDKRLAVP